MMEKNIELSDESLAIFSAGGYVTFEKFLQVAYGKKISDLSGAELSHYIDRYGRVNHDRGSKLAEFGGRGTIFDMYNL